MKILNPIKVKKNSNSKTSNQIKRILNSPKGPNLRSRKIIYQEEILEYSDDEQRQNIEIVPEKKEKKQQKPHQSEQQQKSKEDNLKNKPSQQKDKEEDQFENEQSNLDEEKQNEQNFTTPVKRKKRQCRPFPARKIFETKQFKKIKEIDFMLYFRILSKAKMFSTLLINEFGQVIFADRLGSQHFEGSLNNFARNPIYSMILECEQATFFDKTSQLKEDGSIVLKLLIYSKNSKRRYSKSTNEISLTNQDLFNRYLKCISCQVLPIQVTIASTEQYEGFWNHSLFNLNQPVKCFLFKSRLSKNLPDLSGIDLKEDKKIEKFLKYTRRKQAEKDETLVKKQFEENYEQQRPKDSCEQNFEFSYAGLNQLDVENCYIDMHEMKHTKSTQAKSFALNSGEGKRGNQRQIN